MASSPAIKRANLKYQRQAADKSKKVEDVEQPPKVSYAAIAILVILVGGTFASILTGLLL